MKRFRSFPVILVCFSFMIGVHGPRVRPSSGEEPYFYPYVPPMVGGPSIFPPLLDPNTVFGGGSVAPPPSISYPPYVPPTSSFPPITPSPGGQPSLPPLVTPGGFVAPWEEPDPSGISFSRALSLAGRGYATETGLTDALKEFADDHFAEIITTGAVVGTLFVLADATDTIDFEHDVMDNWLGLAAVDIPKAHIYGENLGRFEFDSSLAGLAVNFPDHTVSPTFDLSLVWTGSRVTWTVYKVKIKSTVPYDRFMDATWNAVNISTGVSY